MSFIQRSLNLYFQIKRKLLTYSIFQKYQHIRTELENQKQNRELIGEDRDGNKYYQYYSYFGLPTRREIEFKDRNNISMTDLVYYDWLTKRISIAPSEIEKQQFYEEERLRIELGRQWDQKEQALIDSFRQERQKLIEFREQQLLKHQEQLNSGSLETLKQIKQYEKLNDEEQKAEQKDSKFEPQGWQPRGKSRR